MIAATRLPWCATAVHALDVPGSGSVTGWPRSSTNSCRSGSQYAIASVRSPSRSASASRTGTAAPAGLERPRRLTCEINAAVASRAPTDSIRAGMARSRSTSPTTGPRGHGPRYELVLPVSPSIECATSSTNSAVGSAQTNRRTQADRKLSGQERDLPSCHRGVGRQGRRSRDPRAQQPVDQRLVRTRACAEPPPDQRLRRSAGTPGRRYRPPGSPAETAACGPRRRAGAGSPALRWHVVRAPS